MRMPIVPVRLPLEQTLDAVKQERQYQDLKWGSTPSEGRHTVGEYLGFFRHYLGEAERQMATQSEPHATEEALHTVRKLAGLAVACMQDNGVRRRSAEEMRAAGLWPNKKVDLTPGA